MVKVNYRFPKGVKPEDITTHHLAQRVLTGEHFARDPGGHLYVYRNGVYVPEGKRAIEVAVGEVLEANSALPRWSRRMCDETIGYIQANAAPDLLERPPMNVLNLSDCLLDIHTEGLNGELTAVASRRNHSPEFLSTVQLPVKYDPEAPAPNAWMTFLEEVLPVDCVLARVIWHIIAWLMLPNMALQLSLLFMSEQAGTGKSTLLKAIMEFLRKGNIATESLQDLEENRFRAANLHGKLLNVYADLRGGKLATSNVFKIITCEDFFTVERKFGHPFRLRPFCRLVFSTNNFPVVEDAGEAFFSRWRAIKFETRFRGTPRQRGQDEILAELTTPQELSGVLNMALEVLPCVLDPKKGIPEPPSCVKARLEFEARTSPVAVWLRANVMTGSDKSVEKQRLREAYNQDAASNGRPMSGDKAFGVHLWNTYKSQLGERRDSYGTRPNFWIGIGLIETNKEEAGIIDERQGE